MGYASIAFSVIGIFNPGGASSATSGGGTKLAAANPTVDLGQVIVSDAPRVSAAGQAASNAAKAARLAKLGSEVSALAATALTVSTLVAAVPFIPEASLVSTGVGAINGGVGGAITGYAGAVAKGTNPYWGAAKGAFAGALMGGAVGAAFPGLAASSWYVQAMAGSLQSAVGQVGGNVVTGRSAFDHISYGALVGSAAGGPMGAGVEGLILLNGANRPIAAGLSGVLGGSMETAGDDAQRILGAGY